MPNLHALEDGTSKIFSTCTEYMARKGVVSEIFSRALHHDEPRLYHVGYNDLGTTRELTLPEFLKLSEGFQIIPASRILYIKKGSDLLYSRRPARKNRSPS